MLYRNNLSPLIANSGESNDQKDPLLALGFGMALASARAFAHGNHSHGPALTEVERQASEGILRIKMCRTAR